MNQKMNSKRLFAASWGHFSVDTLTSSVPIVLTVIATTFNLSVSQIGIAAMFYTFASSLTQPLFGILVDKVRGRWVCVAGLLWTTLFYALTPLMPNFPALVTCLTLGALGSGAYHPAGLVNSTMAGGSKPTTATSLFFVGGQAGLAVGPILVGVLLQHYGLVAMPYTALLMIPALLFVFWYLRQPYEAQAIPLPKSAAPAGDTPSLPASTAGLSYVVISGFILLIVFRSTTSQGFPTLLPKYFADQGYSSASYGVMLGVLALAGAIGTLLGGWLGDRFNRRMIIFISMILYAFSSLAMLYTAGFTYVVAALIAGTMMNIPHSILILMAQRLIPGRQAMIGGAVLGLMFASGAAVTGLASWIADYVGLPSVLAVMALLPLGAALCALMLPSTRGVEPIVDVTTHETAPSAAGD